MYINQEPGKIILEHKGKTAVVEEYLHLKYSYDFRFVKFILGHFEIEFPTIKKSTVGLWGGKEIYTLVPDIKGANKGFTEEFGITPNKLKTVYNAAQNTAFPGMEYWVKKFYCRRYARYINSILKVLPVLEQLKADGIENVAPIVLMFLSDPKECKKRVGKGLWKRLCKNTFTRNFLLTQQYQMELSVANTVSSTLLKTRAYDPRFDPFLSGTLKERAAFIKNNFYELRDSILMAGELGYKIRRGSDLEEVHSHLVKLYHREEYSDEPFKEREDVHEALTELVSPAQIYAEGKSMRHCVASYIPAAVDGNYRVFSILLEGKHIGTAGYAKKRGNIFVLEQARGKCNKDINNLVDLPKVIMK